MRAFRDIRLPAGVKGYPTSGAPRFSTHIVGVASGDEHRNQNWAHPLHRYTLAEAVREHTILEALRKHWFNMGGPAFGFPFLDPLDFASVDLPAPNVVPTVSATDAVLGVGDGLNRFFQLAKPYRSFDPDSGEDLTYRRKITLPIVETVLVAVDCVDPAAHSPPLTWEVSRDGGIVEFNLPPLVGEVVTGGFLFEVPVRYEADDQFEGIVKNFRVSGFADLSLVELRPC